MKNIKLRAMLVAVPFIATPALLPTMAKAQALAGPYISANLGYNVRNSRDINSLTAFAPPTLHVAPITESLRGTRLVYHNGFAGNVAIGYGFGNGFRIELEGGYAENRIKKIDVAVPGLPTQEQASLSGTGLQYSAMVNGYYDFDLGLPYVYPFIGAGIGYEWLQGRNVGIPPLLTVSGTPSSFAYQGIVGLSFPIRAVPGLSATVQYRYLATTGNESYSFHIPLGSQTISGNFNLGSNSNNMLFVGLRYELFPPTPPAPAPVPTPAPVAAPAPAPARTYLVFFNWDKASLTPRATQIISEAAKASETTKVTRLNVNGYTDTSGSPAYNMKLSLRRAKNVAAKLVSDGVPTQDIVIKGYGETHLLVPTGPNVREPQNRRVEIILH